MPVDLILTILVVMIMMAITAMNVPKIDAQFEDRHDGRCYLCRRGKCQPGELCNSCGTHQPL